MERILNVQSVSALMCRHCCFINFYSNKGKTYEDERLCFHRASMFISKGPFILKTCGATRNPEFPRTGPDRTETGPGSGNIFKNIFGSGRVGEFYFGSVRVEEFYFGSVRVVVFFLPGYETFSPGISGINLPFIPKQRKWNGYYP